jgi:N-acetylmuramoyl-L-alanine amidase
LHDNRLTVHNKSRVRAFGIGASGDHVRDLQQRLTSLGFQPGQADGDFGSTSEVAVRVFQESRGLDVDGICGPDTWSAVVEAGHRLGDRLLYLHSPMLRGDDIADLQQQLASLGFDPGRVDSILGPETGGAVAEFQRNTGLVSDGICGPETVRMFARLSRKGPAATNVSAVREIERLRAGPPTLVGRRVVIGERGGLDALAAALRRVLGDLGADVVTVHHPDWEYQARQANAFDADVFVGLVVRDDAELSMCYFESELSASAAGKALAAEMALCLDPILGTPAVRGMRLPILRATRMPAVVCRLGSVPRLVPRTPVVARALRVALEKWIKQPEVDDTTLVGG